MPTDQSLPQSAQAVTPRPYARTPEQRPANNLRSYLCRAKQRAERAGQPFDREAATAAYHARQATEVRP